MPTFIYFNDVLPSPGCECHNCTHWFDIANDKLRIGTLIGLRNRVDYDQLCDWVLVHEGRPIQLIGMERVTFEVLIQMLDSQYYQYIDPWDNFVFVWGRDLFTDEVKNFISGTAVLFDIAMVKTTQYKLMGLNDRNDSIVLNLFDIQTGRKITYTVTESFWGEQIVRLWGASEPLPHKPSLLHALTSPLDPIMDSYAVEYVQNVPWTVPHWDTWTGLAALLSYDGSPFPDLEEDLCDEIDHMNPNNILFNLPEDIILSIVDWLEPEAQAVMRRVCRRFENMIRRPVTVTLLEWMDDKRIIDMRIWEYR